MQPLVVLSRYMDMDLIGFINHIVSLKLLHHGKTILLCLVCMCDSRMRELRNDRSSRGCRSAIFFSNENQPDAVSWRGKSSRFQLPHFWSESVCTQFKAWISFGFGYLKRVLRQNAERCAWNESVFERLYFTMNVPVDATNIQFNVYTHSVIGWGQVTMSNGYGYASNTAFQLFGWGGECNVAPPVSGVPYRFPFSFERRRRFLFILFRDDSTRPSYYNLGYE